ncbi:MAG: type II secretion system protein [Candidatus Omnitrophota bacterium]
MSKRNNNPKTETVLCKPWRVEGQFPTCSGNWVAGGHRGFTFVELMVVVGLFAIVGTVLMSSFAMGLRVWKKAASSNFNARGAMLTMARWTTETRRVFQYQPIGFFGNETHVEFANILNNKILNISYDFSSNENVVRRTAVSRQALLEGEADGVSRTAISDAQAFSLAYYGWDAQLQDYAFYGTWNSSQSGWPVAVRFQVDLKDGETFEKVIPLQGWF